MPLFARAAPAVVATPEGHSLRTMLDEIDPDTLTPRGALEALYRLKAAAEG
jgi:DNA mismatch repair protein MutS